MFVADLAALMEATMAIVNREWVGSIVEGTRRLVVSDVRGVVDSYEILFNAALTRMGGHHAAIEYGIKAAISDAGSGGKSASDKIKAAKTWLEGSPDPRAVVAELQKKEVEWAAERARLEAEMRELREKMLNR